MNKEAIRFEGTRARHLRASGQHGLQLIDRARGGSGGGLVLGLALAWVLAGASAALAQQLPVSVAASVSQTTVNEGSSFAITVSANAPWAVPYNVYLGLDLLDAAGQAGPNDLDGAVVAWVVMPANNNTVVLNLSARADQMYEGNETFQVYIRPEPGAGEPIYYRPVGGTNTVTLVDQDPWPEVYFDTPTNIVVEPNPGFDFSVKFRVLLSPRSQAPVSVNWSLAPAPLTTATPGVDFKYLSPGSLLPLPADGIIDFLGGVGTNKYEVVVNGDALDEADEKAVLQLSVPVGASLRLRPGFSTNAILILDDDELPVVSFRTSASSGPATETSRSVEVRLNTPSGRTNTVNWSVTGGTATPGVDFTGPTSGILAFPPGVTDLGIPISVVNDLVTEPDETVILTLSNPVNATLGAITTHTNTIRDDDVNFSWGLSYRQTNVVEGSSGPNRFALPIVLSRVMSQEVTVEVTERTVVPDVDYTRISPPRVSIPAGQTQATFVIDINGDTVDELDENVFFGLTLPNLGTVTGNPEFQVTIVDDDAPAVQVTFGSASRTVTEGNTSVFVDVFLSQLVDRPVWVTFNTTGTATAGQDYNLFGANPNLVSFSPGQDAQQVRIDLLDDAIWEDQETLTLRFSGFNGTAPGQITNFTLRINDSRPAPTAAFGNFSTSFQEAFTSPDMPVQLSAPAAIPVKVSVAVTGGTATGSGTDYTFNAGAVYFETGETQKNVNLSCVNDILDELDETIALTLAQAPLFPSDGYVSIRVAGITNRTFTIVDDDTPPTITIVQPLFVLSEGQSSNATFRLSKPSGLPISLNVARSSSTASDADVTLSLTTLNLAAGETQKVVTITALDDALVEGDESFALSMLSPVNVVLGSARAVFIRDLDGTRVVPEDPTALGLNPGHRVRFRKAAGATTLTTINEAEAFLALPLSDTRVAFEVYDPGVPVINYTDAASDPPPQGNAGEDRDFHAVPGSPTFAAGGIDHFALSARGHLYVPMAGNWNFIVRSDDGFRLRIGSNQTVVAEYVNGRGPADSLAVVDFPQSGYYRYELTYFEWGGGAQVEWLAAPPFEGGGLSLVGSGSEGLVVFQDLDVPPVIQPAREPVGVGGAGFQAEFRKSSFNQSNVIAAQALFALAVDDARVLAVASDHGVSVINYNDDYGIPGVFAGDRLIAPPPLSVHKGSFSTGGDDNFALRASGLIYIPNPGVWSFAVSSDDGYWLKMGANFQVVSAYPNPRGFETTTNRVHIPVAGYYPFELLFFEWGGGAMVEFFALGPGQSQPRLVGDAAGELRVFQPGGVIPPRLSMETLPARAVVRWPFSATPFTLESTASLTPPRVWSPVGIAPVLVGSQWNVTNSLAPAARFFRLRYP